MSNLDYNNLAIAVEKRLDEIFGEDVKGENPRKSKLKLVKPHPLANLKNIIMSLEWEVSEKNLKDLIQEITKLQKVYIEDHLLQKLLKILFQLGKYIRDYRSNTPPRTFRMLFQVYNGLTKIASGKFSDQQKVKIVNNEIKRYFFLMSYLKRKNKDISRGKVNKLKTSEKKHLKPGNPSGEKRQQSSKDEGKIKYSALATSFMGLKKFIYIEIKKLRMDVQRIAVLLNAKT